MGILVPSTQGHMMREIVGKFSRRYLARFQPCQPQHLLRASLACSESAGKQLSLGPCLATSSLVVSCEDSCSLLTGLLRLRPCEPCSEQCTRRHIQQVETQPA